MDTRLRYLGGSNDIRNDRQAAVGSLKPENPGGGKPLSFLPTLKSDRRQIEMRLGDLVADGHGNDEPGILTSADVIDRYGRSDLGR